MVQTQIELTEEQMKALEEIAQKRHIPLAELIREGVDRLLQSEGLPSSHAALRQRALGIAGRFKSGLGDLSRRHDDYLVETTDS